MQGKVLIVTGALGALGKVVAETALARGARVAGIDHAPSQMSATPERIEIGGVDLSDPAQAKTAVEAAAKHFGRLDALINIAGGFAFETVGDGDIKTWQRMHALNVLTALNTSRAALPHLAASGAGRIVNIGAMGALQAGSGMGPYAASKAGVHRLTEALANEWKGKVTVNRGAAVDHRHQGQPRRHAESGFLQMGDTAGTRRGDPLPRQRCRERRHRRADPGERPGLVRHQ
ncbi:NAD(P)-dependent dehydrogenase (short-subunit alcohol dehydrogenase family) [Bradyrhizobium barranii subsp. barranii]